MKGELLSFSKFRHAMATLSLFFVYLKKFFECVKEFWKFSFLSFKNKEVKKNDQNSLDPNPILGGPVCILPYSVRFHATRLLMQRDSYATRSNYMRNCYMF